MDIEKNVHFNCFLMIHVLEKIHIIASKSYRAFVWTVIKIGMFPRIPGDQDIMGRWFTAQSRAPKSVNGFHSVQFLF